MIVYREAASLARDLGVKLQTLYALSNSLPAHYHTVELPKPNGGVRRLTVPDAPVLLDDALCAFDDKRMGLALALLKELGAERQILLFSCHGREAAWGGAHGVPVIEGWR